MEQIDETWKLYENQSNKINDARMNLIILGTTIASSWLTSVIDAYFFSGYNAKKTNCIIFSLFTLAAKNLLQQEITH